MRIVNFDLPYVQNEVLGDWLDRTSSIRLIDTHRLTTRLYLGYCLLTSWLVGTKTLVQYIHATLFSPSKSTLLNAIRNGLLSGWPGLTLDNVNKYLAKTTATAKGHLDQHRMNLQSTTRPRSHLHSPPDDFSPPPEPIRSNQTIATIINQSKNNMSVSK